MAATVEKSDEAPARSWLPMAMPASIDPPTPSSEQRAKSVWLTGEVRLMALMAPALMKCESMRPSIRVPTCEAAAVSTDASRKPRKALATR